jgi:diguanylate cyclase (GGDEF)-like protein
MRTRSLNGSAYPPAAARSGARRKLNATLELSAGDLARPRSGETPPDTEGLYLALATSQQQLGTALEQIEALLRQESLLRQEVMLLEQAAAQARQFAHHDELTGLPNRRLLWDRFRQAVAQGTRQHRPVALLFLDLDGFKSINDTLGHAAGDRMLQQVAARLVACTRTSDTACRYGGDEFVILLPEFEGQDSAVAAAEKIRAHLETPYVIDGTAIRMTISIGVAVYPSDGKEYGDLIRVSDCAMYRNKARGPAPPSVIEPAAQTCGRPNGIDSTEEYSHASELTEANAIGDELRSHAGRSVQ